MSKKGTLNGWDGRFKSCKYWIAVGFGSGLIRPAPGTWGSLAGLAIGMAAFYSLPLSIFSAIIILTYLLGARTIDAIERFTGVHDAPEIVIDEFVGQWIAIIPLFIWRDTAQEFAILWAVAFILFRVFDILKPWPIGPIDKKVSGGHGVMLDDVVAGIIAALILVGMILFWH